MKKLIVLIAISMTVASSWAQSPWNKKKGEGFVKLSETIIVSDQFYDPSGNIQPITTTGVYITSIYGEYGLSDKLTAFIYFPFFFRNTLNEQQLVNSGTTVPGDESNGVGDTNIGISYGIKQNGPFVLNTSLLLGLPIGETEGGDTGLLQSGDGEFNQLVKLNAGYSFYPIPIYVIAGIGLNNRTNDFSDELHINGEVGLTIKSSFNVAFKVYSLSSFDNGDADANQNGIFSNNTEYFAYGPELSYTHNDRFGASITYQGALSGQNILANPSYSFGLHYKF